ncbi:hypothetical protein GIB67_018478 [Kingdonia uniflora]|uniref:Secreted protein n=1 Tax=Kingdonia uniflora TaxID=39325 RepID=A0A7J7LW27_9MAGN|nr:hypothetical protein GIB67_018478 [Kingdonia uniflora]
MFLISSFYWYLQISVGALPTDSSQPIERKAGAIEREVKRGQVHGHGLLFGLLLRAPTVFHFRISS